jgi:hypothetical protein
MIPYLVVLSAIALGAFLFTRRPVLPAALANADALTLLNFPPFTLKAGESTTLVYLAPSGLSPQAAQTTIQNTVGPVDAVELTRRNVPLPTPPGSPIQNVTADVWTMRCSKCGPPAGSPDTVFTPAFVVSQILRRRGLPVTAAVNVEPARQLAGILYANAMTGAGSGATTAEFIPIAARQGLL